MKESIDNIRNFESIGHKYFVLYNGFFMFITGWLLTIDKIEMKASMLVLFYAFFYYVLFNWGVYKTYILFNASVGDAKEKIKEKVEKSNLELAILKLRVFRPIEMFLVNTIIFVFFLSALLIKQSGF